MLVYVQIKPNLEETNISSQYANTTVSQSFYPRNSEQPKSPLSNLARQRTAPQDLTPSMDIPQVYACHRDSLLLNTEKFLASTGPL